MRPIAFFLAALFALQGCEDSQPPAEDMTEPAPPVTSTAEPERQSNPDRNAYYGDLHVHTMYSFDAFAMGTLASPDDAYEFAKGGKLTHPGGFDMQMEEPLDFYGVSDHAFFMGALRAMTIEETGLYDHELAESVRGMTDEASRGAQFRTLVNFVTSDRAMELVDDKVFNDAWQDTIAAANRHYEPGEFTTFIAYEYTSSGDEFENLHRNVIYRGDTAPALPFSRLDSRDPEDLWQWMDEQREAGHEAIAIPHNSNGSNGEMFSLLTYDGNPLTAAYADQRMRNEPLVENSQIKGTSDTHPALSPNDEWADFEIMTVRIASTLPSKPEGSYVREALMNGIEMQVKKGFNPFKFGVIGSSDTHNASYAGDEHNYWSKTGILDDEPVERASVPRAEPQEDGSEYTTTYRHMWSAGSLAGVWAEENTREAIYDAFRRKETFSTSGTRIKVRFFAGYDLPATDASDLVSKAYASGIAMGGDLAVEGDVSPEFLVWAARDANSAPLQRLQIIKANVRDGKAVEQVFDVACSDGGEVDPETQRCPDNGATVDLSDCSVSSGSGASELKTLWQDPDFDPNEHALYYVRVLENPVCRWSTWDALRTGVEPRKDLQATIQERAWTSPIWVTPGSAE